VPVGAGVWVWLGGTLLLLVRMGSRWVFSPRCVWGGVWWGPGLGILLGPEETPACRVFFGPLLAVVV
jgi:hypothetical protein